jgi:alkylated DNA repair dioxygenase AlkB
MHHACMRPMRGVHTVFCRVANRTSHVHHACFAEENHAKPLKLHHGCPLKQALMALQAHAGWHSAASACTSRTSRSSRPEQHTSSSREGRVQRCYPASVAMANDVQWVYFTTQSSLYQKVLPETSVLAASPQPGQTWYVHYHAAWAC